jgi:hypothetical protein
LVAVTDLGSGKLEYELLGKPHHHLICERCSTRIEVEDHFFEPLRVSLRNITASSPIWTISRCSGCVRGAPKTLDGAASIRFEDYQ